MKGFTVFLIILSLVLFSCFSKKTETQENQAESVNSDNSENSNMNSNELVSLMSEVLIKAQLPEELTINLLDLFINEPAFLADLAGCFEEDFHLRELVDKKHPLASDYIPEGLVALAGGSYRLGRSNLMLKDVAAISLDEMATAARTDGVIFTAGSAYRSFDYQKEVYERNVRILGQAAADRESARPGHSQHQSGLVLDFSPIDDSFANTEASRWLVENASKFGWSLSFPEGYEEHTGYRYESWHYRYVGKKIAAFIDNYFGGIQQFALRFLYEWEKINGV